MVQNFRQFFFIIPELTYSAPKIVCQVKKKKKLVRFLKLWTQLTVLLELVTAVLEYLNLLSLYCFGSISTPCREFLRKQKTYLEPIPNAFSISKLCHHNRHMSKSIK